MKHPLLQCSRAAWLQEGSGGGPQYAHPPQKITFLIQIYDEEARTGLSRRKPQDRRRKPESDSRPTTHDVIGGKQTTQLITNRANMLHKCKSRVAPTEAPRQDLPSY